MRIEEALERFLVQLEADGRSLHTTRQYARHVRLLARWARQDGHCRDRIERLGHEDVARFLASRAATTRPDGRKKKAAAANCLRSSVKGFFRYCHQAGLIHEDPSRLTRRAICSPPPPRALTPEEEERLLATLAQAEGELAERDHTIIALMLSTGVRVGAAVAIDIEHVDLERRVIEIPYAKGGVSERVLLGDSITEHLRLYIGDRTSGPLFCAGDRRICVRHVQRRFSMWIRKAGIKRSLSAHSARHTYAMKVYSRSGDLLVTQAAMRHRSVASTTVYARASEDQIRRVI